MVTLINEDTKQSHNERKFVFIIDMCVHEKRKISRDDFYVVHPTSCTISLKSISKYSNSKSVCWLVTFSRLIEWRWRRKKRRFVSVFLHFHRKNFKCFVVKWLSMCRWASGKCFQFNGNLLFPQKKCLKMALELVGVALILLVTNTTVEYLSSN